jgi:hypothetical protein
LAKALDLGVRAPGLMMMTTSDNSTAYDQHRADGGVWAG